MSKTEYAWVIQRDDGKFFSKTEHPIFYVFCNLGNSEISSSKEIMQYIIKKYNLQNCRPVRIKIEIVGEDNE